MSVTLEPAERRRDDPRIDRIEAKVDQVLEKLEDPTKSPVGRILTDRADRNEKRIDGLDDRVDVLERMDAQRAGAMAFVRIVQVILAAALALLGIFVALRQGIG